MSGSADTTYKINKQINLLDIHRIDKPGCVWIFFFKYRNWEESASEHPWCNQEEKEEKNKGKWQLHWDIWG